MADSIGTTDCGGKPDTKRTEACHPLHVNKYAMNILFVDDDKDTRDLFRLVFSLEGHSVEMAEDAPSALMLLRDSKAHFDVTVVDYFMPGINGLEMVRQFNQGRAPKQTSFVLFTRAHPGDLKQEAKELGITFIVHKPTVTGRVVEAVEQAARHRTRERA